MVKRYGSILTLLSFLAVMLLLTAQTPVYSVSFYEREYYDEKTAREAMAYMVGLPEYADSGEQIKIPETMKSQACMVAGRYYFRITEDIYI